MKAVHISTVHKAIDRRIMDKEARALAVAGWDVVVILPHPRTELVDGIRVVGVPNTTNRVLRSTVTAFRALRKALVEKGDVYHFHDPELIPVGVVLRLLGKRVIYDVHETHSATVAQKPYIPRWIRPPLSWVIQHVEFAAAKIFSGLVPATPGIGGQFSHLKTPQVTVQNFPRLQPQRGAVAPLRSRSRKVVHTGMVSESRGLLTMIEAIGLVDPAICEELILASEVTPASLEKARLLAGWSRVNLTGAFKPNELPGLLSQARVGLVLFHPYANHIESYPTKLFEYMAGGLPVIASNFALWEKIVSESRCGLLVDPLRPAEIAEAIQYLLTHDDVAEEMGANGKAAVASRFNWDAEARKLTDFYETLAADQLGAPVKAATHGLT
jgi:glycosyltransferase involved in cell wall biosynthesis